MREWVQNTVVAVLAITAALWLYKGCDGEAARVQREPVLPSTQVHEVIIQRKVLIGLGVYCREDAEHNIMLCGCVE
jgi:hypothetical protein